MFLIAVQEKELVVCGQECPVIYRNLSEYFLNCRYIAGNCCSRKRDGGLWSAIAINDQQLKEKKYISTDDTDGGPQADCFEERELWRIDRELKEIGPQADGVGDVKRLLGY